MNDQQPSDGTMPGVPLRSKAEQLLRTSRTDVSEMAAEDIQALVHELQVHQIELQLQNEELQTAQHELADSRERYRNLYESAPVGYLSIEPNGEIRQANLSAATILGVDRDALVHRQLSDFVSRDSQDDLYRHHHEVMFNQKATCELTILRPDATPCVVRLKSVATSDQSGPPTYFRAAVIDVTQQKEAEQWVIQANRLRTMVENLPAGAVFVEHETVEINRTMETLTGYSRDEIQTVDQWHRKLYGAREAEMRQLHLDARRAGFPKPMTIKIQRKDGCERTVEFAGHELDDHQVWLIHDVTERHEAELALRESEHRFAMLADNVPDMFAFLDSDQHYRFVNRQYEVVFALPKSEIIGKHVKELLGEVQYGRIQHHIESVLSGESVRYENRLSGSNGERWVTVTLEPHELGGHVVGFFTLVTDITDRVRLEKEQKRYHQVLEALSTGAPVNSLLQMIMQQAEGEMPGMLGSIMLLDEFGDYLSGHYGDSLPSTYRKAIEGIKIGPNVGSCGTAAFTGRRVIVEDIETHPYWREYRDLASESQLRACWSEPILSPSHEVLGVMAMYFREPQKPTDYDLHLLEHTARVAGIAIDRSRSTERLRKSEQRYRSLASAFSSIVWVTSPDGRMEFPQRAWEQYTGQPWTEHQGDGWLQMIHQDDQERIRSLWTEAVRTGNQYLSNGRVWHDASKDYHYFEANAVPILDKEGKITEWVGTVTDVHDRTEAEHRIREQEREFRLLADNVPELFSYIDSEQCFQFVNRSHEKLHDQPRSKFIGKHVRDILGEQAYQTTVREPLEKALAGEQILDESEMELGDLGKRWCRTSYLPNIKSGQVMGVFCLITDITERRSLEKQVLHIASEENRRISQDLHDGIGQELTGMGMIADALATALSRRGAPEAKIAVKLQKSSQRTLHQVRALARGMNPVDIDGQGLVVAITEMCDRMRELYNIECHLECPQPIEFRSNQTATQLFRISQEATTNAIKHGKATCVTISLLAGGNVPFLQVIDNGIGFESDAPMTIGMGLRTMRYRAGVIGGRLSIKRMKRSGTRVVCTFPEEDIFRPTIH